MSKQEKVQETKENCSACDLEQAKLKAEENLNLAKYYKAELENFKKRNAERASQMYAEGKSDAILAIVPLVDALYEAVRSSESKTHAEGIEILIRKFLTTLGELGATEIETNLGDKFDPHLHNAVAVGEGEVSNTILEVWQRGFRLGGKVIRPATVKVSN